MTCLFGAFVCFVFAFVYLFICHHLEKRSNWRVYPGLGVCLLVAFVCLFVWFCIRFIYLFSCGYLEKRSNWRVYPGLGDGGSCSQWDLGLDHLVHKTPER